MPINIIAVGRMKEAFYEGAAKEYLKRLQRYDTIRVIEIEDLREPPHMTEALVQQLTNKEGESILAHVKADDHVVALCIEGTQLGSEAFAENINRNRNEGKRMVFIIGGSNGLGQNVLLRTDSKLSFSKMTFPHQLARVILLEQIYRGFKINANERYHK